MTLYKHRLTYMYIVYQICHSITNHQLTINLHGAECFLRKIIFHRLVGIFSKSVESECSLPCTQSPPLARFLSQTNPVPLRPILLSFNPRLDLAYGLFILTFPAKNFIPFTSIYQPTNAHIISHKTLQNTPTCFDFFVESLQFINQRMHT